MTTASPAACQRVNPRRQPPTLPSSYTTSGDTTPIVIMFGMDDGSIPRRNSSEDEAREARRLFCVGFTRAKSEVHMIYTASKPSPFVTEVQERLEAADA
jgi:superfamily I DNA/RNA helicase